MADIVYSTGPDGTVDPVGYGVAHHLTADAYIKCCGYSACYCYDGVNDQ